MQEQAIHPEALNPDVATRIAADALKQCLDGDEAGGLDAYRSIARPRAFTRLPLGLHIHMLREAGRDMAADELIAMTLSRGGDLAWKAVRKGVAPAVAAAEYEEWLARGLANPLMVNRYAGALTRLGRIDEVAAIFDTARLLRRVTIGGADAVARALLDREAELEVGSRISVREMRELLGVHLLPEFAPLIAECRAAITPYLADWAASDHPLASLVPRDFKIGAWGLISRGEGYNTRHQHSVGWATAVYYPMGLPDEMKRGSLKIGGWNDPAPPGWPDFDIRPEPGLLVVMPSYYVHWTDPLGAPGLRLSVALDAIPA